MQRLKSKSSSVEGVPPASGGQHAVEERSAKMMNDQHLLKEQASYLPIAVAESRSSIDDFQEIEVQFLFSCLVDGQG